jgi:hypothetical protein
MRRLAGAVLLAVGAMAAGPALGQQRPDKKDVAPRQAPSPAPASEQRPQQPAGIAVPPPEVLLVLLRTSLLALDHANKTNDYAVLRALGAPELQKFTAEQLRQMFAGLRTANIDLSPVAVITPQVLEPPQITPQGLLKLLGFFPTQPLQIQFEILFQPVGGQWRVFGLTVRAAAAGR